MKKKTTTIFVTLLIFIGFFTISPVLSSPLNSRNSKSLFPRSHQQLSYININASEAYDLLSTLDNGIQIPIDVRTDLEWNDERIDTPFPEFPRHFIKDDILNEQSYEGFIELYNGSDVIIYCKSGGRSATSAQVLVDRGFGGIVYNMVGGITSWKQNGYPTKLGNNNPETPITLQGPSVCTINIPNDFIVQSEDSDNDVLRYGIDWDSDNIIDEWTPYAISGEKLAIDHSWNNIGIYNVSYLAEDNVGERSDFSSILSVRINTPPNAPTINGPQRGKPGEDYIYKIVSEDIDDDELSYYIEWGDGNFTGWTRTLSSGEILDVSYNWGSEDTYIIRVKAKDQWEAESDWTTLEVIMPYSMRFQQLYQFTHSLSLCKFLFDFINILSFSSPLLTPL